MAGVTKVMLAGKSKLDEFMHAITRSGTKVKGADIEAKAYKYGVKKDEWTAAKMPVHPDQLYGPEDLMKLKEQRQDALQVDTALYYPGEIVPYGDVVPNLYMGGPQRYGVRFIRWTQGQSLDAAQMDAKRAGTLYDGDIKDIPGSAGLPRFTDGHYRNQMGSIGGEFADEAGDDVLVSSRYLDAYMATSLMDLGPGPQFGKLSRVLFEGQSDWHRDLRLYGVSEVDYNKMSYNQRAEVDTRLKATDAPFAAYDEAIRDLDSFERAVEMGITDKPDHLLESVERQLYADAEQAKEDLKLALEHLLEVVPSRQADRADAAPLTGTALEELMYENRPSTDLIFGTNITQAPWAPWAKSWRKHWAVNELETAIMEEPEQLIIPLSGHMVQRLHRGGNQARYTADVAKVFEKEAKNLGLSYRYVSDDTPIKVYAGQKDDLGRVAYSPQMLKNFATTLSMFEKEAGGVIARRKLIRQLGYSGYPIRNDMPNSELIDIYLNKMDKDGMIEVPRYNALVINTPTRRITRNSERYLYSQAAPSVAMGAYLAMKEEGWSEDQVRSRIEEVGRHDPDHVIDMLPGIKKALDDGYTHEQVLKYLNDKYDRVPMTQTSYYGGRPRANKQEQHANQVLKWGKNYESFSEFYNDAYGVAAQLPSFWDTVKSWTGNDEAKAYVEKLDKNHREAMVRLAKNQLGIDIVYREDKPYVKGKQYHVDGKLYVDDMPLDHGFWDVLANYKGEITLGVIGGIAGATLLAPVTTSALVAAAGSFTMGAGLSTFGAEIDYMTKVNKLGLEVNEDIKTSRQLNALEESALGEVAGWTIKGMWHARKPIGHVFGVVRDALFSHGEQAAAQAAREVAHMSEDQAQAFVKEAKRILQNVPDNKYQETMAVLSQTRPGGDLVTQAATNLDGLATQRLVKTISDRAKMFKSIVHEIPGDRVVNLLRTDLMEYEQSVQNLFEFVVESARMSDGFIHAPDDVYKGLMTDFMKVNMYDSKISSILQTIKRMEDTTKGPTKLEHMVQIRDDLQRILISKSLRPEDQKVLQGTLGRIDKFIDTRHADSFSDKEVAAKWYEAYHNARKARAELHDARTNALYQALMNKDMPAEETIQHMLRYASSIDGTFNTVLNRLPPAGRARAEGALVDALVDKYTAGVATEYQAINFPMLADELSNIYLRTAEAKLMKQAVNVMAEVFRNDVRLAQSTGKITIPVNQTYLTADPRTRLKFEIATGYMAWVRNRLPGTQTARNMALVTNMGEILKNPLQVKGRHAILEEARRKGLDHSTAEDIKAYIRSAELNDGIAELVPIDSRNRIVDLTSDEAIDVIPKHRIATHADAAQIAELEGIDMFNTELLDEALKVRGFKAFQEGSEQLRVFK